MKQSFTSESTPKDVKKTLAEFDKYKTENRISEDLKFMAKFYKEEQKHKAREAEYLFLRKLLYCIEPCCWKAQPE